MQHLRTIHRRPRDTAGAAVWLAVLLLGALPLPAAADPGYYVLQPYDKAGIGVVELRWWDTRRRGAATVVWPEVGVGYGVNSRWTTTAFASWIGRDGAATRLSTFNWQNSVLLTQGEWPVDVALHLQWIHDPTPPKGRALEYGVLLMTHLERTQLNLNVIFERLWGDATAASTNLKMQWQLRHPLARGVQAGLQGFSELGRWDDWSARPSHRVGPALFGSLRLDNGRVLGLQAAWLVGRTFGRHGQMLSARAALEF